MCCRYFWCDFVLMYCEIVRSFSMSFEFCPLLHTPPVPPPLLLVESNFFLGGIWNLPWKWSTLPIVVWFWLPITIALQKTFFALWPIFFFLVPNPLMLSNSQQIFQQKMVFIGFLRVPLDFSLSCQSTNHQELCQFFFSLVVSLFLTLSL